MKSQNEKMVKHALLSMETSDYGSDNHTMAALAAWSALGSACREQLTQLLKRGPVWDGDILSKQSRDALLEVGLALRCCSQGEQGFTAASYSAYTVHRIGKELL